MKILDRYLGAIIFQYTMLVMMVLLGLFTFVIFLDQLDSIGKGNYGLFQAIIYVILVIPGTIYELFPMAALLGTILGLSMLANDSELIVMRASGVSMLQITTAALKVGGIFVMVAILIGELVSPYTEAKAQRGRVEALEEDIKQHTDFGLWMRDGQSYINIGEILPDLTLLNLRVFQFDPNHKIRSLVRAKSGQFQGDAWLLKKVRQTLVEPDGTTKVLKTETSKWESVVNPQILSVFLIKPDQLSFFQLSKYINHLNKNQQKTDPYELAFWSKIMLPLSTAVMVILAIPFVFTNVRSGTMGRNLFFGIMLGIGFHVTNKGFGYIVLANGVSPLAGAIIPVIVFLILAMLMMRQIE